MGPINTVGYLLQHTATILYRQSDQVLQERLGIGMSQFKLLMILQHHAHVQQRRLAEYLGQTEASISRQIKLLKANGMLEAMRNPEDKREHITVPTPKGIKVAEAAQEILAEYHKPVFEQFSDKQLTQLTEFMRAMHQVSCGSGRPHACENHDI